MLSREKRATRLGREEGLAVGLEEGLERGRAEGREEGVAIGQERLQLEIARKMVNAGKPFSEISEFTGLTQEQLQSL